MDLGIKNVLTVGLNNDELVVEDNIDEFDDPCDVRALMLMVYSLDNLKLSLHKKIAELLDEDS